MKKTIVFPFMFLSIFTQCYASQLKEEFSGYFLFREGSKIIYYDYEDEELDESTPVSLFALDIESFQEDVLLSNCIYWDCVILDKSIVAVTDGKTIFTYNLITKKKEIIYSGLGVDVVISNIVANNCILYFFETDYLNESNNLKKITSDGLEEIVRIPFSSLESPKVYSFSIDGKIVFRSQYLIYYFDVDQRKITEVCSTAIDLSLSDHSIIYSYFQHHDNTTQSQLMEYNLQSGERKDIMNYPFTPHYHTLSSRLINEEYQTYYHEGEKLYLFSNSKWIKVDIDDFLIYEDKLIMVTLRERGFILDTKPCNSLDISSANEIVSLNKQVIPCLIDSIDTQRTSFVGFKNPMSSYIENYHFNQYGIKYAYDIEYVLSKDSVETVNKTWNDNEDFSHWEEMNKPFRIYNIGVIVKQDKNDKLILAPLSQNDMVKIKKMYFDWWELNKDKPIETLREEFREGDKILQLPYVWI